MEDQLKQISRSLNKKDISEESIGDMLEVLSKLDVTVDALKASKIGSILLDIKKNYDGKEVGTKSKQLIGKWRKMFPVTTTNNKEQKKSIPNLSTDTKKNQEESQKSDSQQSFNNGEDNNDDDDDVGIEYNKLPKLRKQIIDILANSFKLNSNESLAKFIAFNVEAAINFLHSAELDTKLYTNKAQTLSVNLKRNEQLRKDVIEGIVSPNQLPYLSTNELATAAQRKEREEVAKNAIMARRGDLYELTRQDIMRANGIDPNKGGEFICSRCKGTKTTHHAMQTRSADEPMTVFVLCLTCGKRWRTQ
eukprot:gene4209-5983_t